MKTLLLGACCLLMGPSFAQQKTEQRFPVKPGTAVVLDMQYATRTSIRSWDQPEVLLQTSVSINGGRNNDALTIKAADTGQQLAIRTHVENIENLPIDKKYHEHHAHRPPGADRPEDQWLNINFVVFVPRNAPVTIHTVSGDIEVNHNGGPLTATSVGGNIYFHIPQGQPADVRLTTDGGEIFTDFGREVFKTTEPPLSSRRSFSGKLRGGGTSVTLASNGGDIHLRKAQ